MGNISVIVDGSVDLCPHAPQGELALSIQDQINSRATAQLTILDYIGEFQDDLPGGLLRKEITISDGPDVLFAGLITNQSQRAENGRPDIKYITLQCVDWTIYCDAKRIFLNFGAGETVSGVVNAILGFSRPGASTGDNLSDLGFTASGASATVIEKPIIFDGATATECFQAISKLTGEHFWIDRNKDIHFAAIGATAAAVVDEDDCRYDSEVLERTLDNFRNTQLMSQEYAVVPPLVQTFQGNGADQSFFVDQPLAIAPRIVLRTAKYAQGTLAFTGVPSAGDTVTVAGQVYTFRTPGNLAAANDVLIGASAEESARNLSYAINGAASWAGAYFEGSTAQNPTCEAAYAGGSELIVRVRVIGTGDGTAVSDSGANTAWASPTLTGAATGDKADASVGILGQDSGMDFYWEPGTTAIHHDFSAAALTSSEFFDVVYNPLFSNIIYVEASASVAAHGRFESMEAAAQGDNGTALLLTAISRLRKYGVTEVTAFSYNMSSFKQPLVNQLIPGMAQTVNLETTWNFSGSALVTSISRSFRYGAGQWRSFNAISAVAYPSGLNEAWDKWSDIFLPESAGGGISGGTVVTPSGGNVTVTLAPGLIRNPVLVDTDQTTDPAYAVPSITFDPPVAQNGFSRLIAWVSASGVIPFKLADQIQFSTGSTDPGAGTYRIPKPTGADSWTGVKLWLVSASPTFENILSTPSGPLQTPSLDLPDIDPYVFSDAALPTAPTAVAVTVIPDGNTFSLNTQWTPADPVGGTTQWARQVRYFNAATCLEADADSEWIDIGPIYGAATTGNQTTFWPKRDFQQWVKLRVRGMNWQDVGSAWAETATGQLIEASTDGAAPLPETPTACSVAIEPRDATFALKMTITPPSPIGGTAGYDREVKYFNDAACTIPDHDGWIPLGWVDKDAGVTPTAFWPRPGYNQWVKGRTRGTNWDGAVTAWVESTTAAALTPLALPPAIATNTTTVLSDNTGAVPKFGFRIAITESGSPGTTEWYECFARYWNDSGLTDPDSDWIYLGGTSRTSLVLEAGYWERPAATQYAKTRIAAKNADGELGPWVESSVLTINPSSGINAGLINVSTLDLANFVITGGKLDIAALGVGISELANAAVTNAKLAAASVASGNIIDGTIIGGDIANSTILGTNIGIGVISGTNIGTGAILGTNIASAAILSSHIQDGTIAGVDIANATIAGTNIQSATIAAGNIVNSTITATQIASSTITATQIASNTITSANIQDGTIVAADLANLTITAAKIQGLTITAAEIANLTINGTKITDSTVTDGKVASGTLGGDKLQNATVTGTKIATGTITGTNIGTATIATSNLGTGVITATNIASLTITASQIADLTITSSKIASISADKITAGTISASISMTAPNISVSGSNFAISINSTNAIRVTGTVTNYTSTVSANGFTTSDTAGNSTTVAPGSIGALGATGQFLINFGANLTLRNLSSQGFSFTPGAITSNFTGGSIAMTGSGQYIAATDYRFNAVAWGSPFPLSGMTSNYYINVYTLAGAYLGKIALV